MEFGTVPRRLAAPTGTTLRCPLFMQKRLASLGQQLLALPAGAVRGHTLNYSLCETKLELVRQTESALGGTSGKGEVVFQSGSVQATYFHAWLASFFHARFAANPVATASLLLPGATN